MGVAVLQREVAGPAHVLDDPLLVVTVFHPRGLFDGGHGPAHAAAVIAAQGILSDHLQSVDLAQMQMPVHEGLRYQAFFGVDDLFRIRRKICPDPGDPAPRDSDGNQLFPGIARSRIPDQQIESHDTIPPSLN